MPKDVSIHNFLLLNLHIVRIANITKLLQILYQNTVSSSKFCIGNIRPVNLHPDIKMISSTWYFLRVWNFKKTISYMNPIFFRLWTIFFGLQFKREEARLNNKKNPDLIFCSLFFVPHILDPIFFRVAIFWTRIVVADWLGDYLRWRYRN